MPAAAIKCGAAERVVPLQDVAPTVLALMGLTPPPEMTGHNLASLRDRADG